MMPMRIIATVLMALLIGAVTAAGQDLDRCPAAADTAHGLVGSEMMVPLRVAIADTDATELRLDGVIMLANPTVFYPERFIALGGDSIVSFSIVSIDSRFHQLDRFSLTIHHDTAGLPRDTLCLIGGEALAGNDSCTIVSFDSLTSGGGALAADDVLALTRSIGAPFPYVRFATLEPGVPNPSKRGDEVAFGYRIDKDSEVTFRVYTLTGAQVYYDDLGYVPYGSYTFRYPIGFEIPSGPFIVRMTTSTGDDYQMFTVIK